GIRDRNVTGVQTCALPISCRAGVLGTGPVRTNDRLVVGESDPGRMSGRTQCLHREPVTEEEMVGCGQCGRRVLVPGGVMAVVVEIGRASCRESERVARGME